MFFGGPDDREALELCGRMVEHPAVKVTVIRFVEKEGMEKEGILLRPSPNKSIEVSYSFSTAKMNREKEKVSLWLVLYITTQALNLDHFFLKRVILLQIHCIVDRN